MCNCALVKNELKEGLTKKLKEQESSVDAEGFKTPVNRYTTEAMPKRIMSLKKTRSKTVHQVPSSIFYRNLADQPSTESQPSSSIDLNATTIRGEQSLTNSQEQLIPSNQDQEEDDEPEAHDGSRMSTCSSTGSSSNNTPNKKGHQKRSSTLRASDSRLNYKSSTASSSSRDLVSVAASLTRSNTISTEKISKAKKHHSAFYKSWRSVKEEDSVLSFHHLPGSSDLGERIANNVDYVDPQQLFCLKATNAIVADDGGSSSKAVFAGQQKLHQRERDSVMSLTSSSDSVDESRNKVVLTGGSYYERMGDDSYYEDDIERCLEDASLFRDSAIYSDDNERERRVVSGGGLETPPPPVPYKPKHVTELQQRRLQELEFKKRQKLAAKSPPSH